ncbi:MAG: AAA family ATPase, partial [Cyanobacteria bacterium REEB65]|nr:AAA family ATPase [Cyanobacteria bacterium REEB65]
MRIDPLKVPFVGRAGPLKALGGVAGKAFDEGPAGVVIEGVPGSGKSRLLAKFLEDQVQEGRATFSIACSDRRLGAFEAFRKLVGKLLPALRRPSEDLAGALARAFPEVPEGPAEKIEPLADRQRLFAATARWVGEASLERPLVVAMDDFQNCDSASAALLYFLATRGEGRLLVVVAGQACSWPP